MTVHCSKTKKLSRLFYLVWDYEMIILWSRNCGHATRKLETGHRGSKSFGGKDPKIRVTALHSSWCTPGGEKRIKSSATILWMIEWSAQSFPWQSVFGSLDLLRSKGEFDTNDRGTTNPVLHPFRHWRKRADEMLNRTVHGKKSTKSEWDHSTKT